MKLANGSRRWTGAVLMRRIFLAPQNRGGSKHSDMWKALKVIIKRAWVVFLLVAGTTFGAMYGWRHGWVGAVVLGFVGFAGGAALARSPALILQFLSAL